MGIRAHPVTWLVILIMFSSGNLAKVSENNQPTNVSPIFPASPFLVHYLLVSYGAKLLPPLSTYWPDFLSISKAIISPGTCVDIVHTFVHSIVAIHTKAETVQCTIVEAKREPSL